MRQVSPLRMLQRMAMAPVKELNKIERYGRDRLTSREKEILGLAVNGRKTAQIACDLSISTQTVCTHFKNIYQKLGVNSRTEAVIFALQQELT
jgi:DNA-binding NarL/FixJ family response regulator